MRKHRFFLIVCALSPLALTSWQGRKAASPDPEQLALQYLSREVPLWYEENGCYSCHNNGDGARVLYIAHRLGHDVPPQALKNTTDWLLRPRDWDENRGDPGFSDKRLARVQFAAALTEARRAGFVEEAEALDEAARTLLSHQSQDGSWPIDMGEQVGSPVTYGIPLATRFSMEALRAGGAAFEAPVSRAADWLLNLEPKSIVDAAAVSLALSGQDRPEWREKRASCYELILESQKRDGGWGPFRHSPAEVFDTSLAILALLTYPADARTRQAVLRGRDYLRQTQLESGAWAETTRPPGGESYAQHISTTAWAAQALLEVRSAKFEVRN